MPLMKQSSVPQALEKSSLNTPRKDHSPPPAYSSEAASINDSAPPDITAAFSNLNLTGSSFPTPDQCIAHLKLLESFHQLREDVALRDCLFGIKDAFVPQDESKERQAEILRMIREKRWAVYVAKAAQRFKSWWTLCVQPQATRTTQSSSMVNEMAADKKLNFQAHDLPPLGKKARLLS